MGKVAGLLHFSWIWTHNVPEAILIGEATYVVASRVIEDVNGHGAAPGHFAHVSECVVEHGQRLTAARQEYVHGLGLVLTVRHGGLMLGQGQPGVPDPQPEVDHDRRHHDHEQQPHEGGNQPGPLSHVDVPEEDPGRCGQQPCEYPAARPAEVPVLLQVVGGPGQVNLRP